MKYTNSVANLPTGKWHIVGSGVLTEYAGVYETKAEADKALIAMNIKKQVTEKAQVSQDWAKDHLMIVF
jgi:hypothetical protein